MDNVFVTEDRAELLRQHEAAWYFRLMAEAEARKWLCEEQRLAHILWGEHPHGY
jgi:hypothetical protein